MKRRQFLLWALCMAGSTHILGRALLPRPRVRFRAADDLAPIPWIGHC